ncbi:unnamed protein product [marine sediment metagenome]|uniref:Uncharacterized protein n=1 Tax=marine sediment metagenome TaxID=412755 RepID=X1B3F0_9ZZZZ
MTETQIRALYDSFDKQDMPFVDFRRELKDVMNPNKMVTDLDKISLRKIRGQMNKLRIDQGVKRNG